MSPLTFDLFREIREHQEINGWSKVPGLQKSHSWKIAVQVPQLSLKHCDAAQQLLCQWGKDIAIAIIDLSTDELN